jgi:hypothetical protein
MKALLLLVLTWAIPQWYLLAQGDFYGCRANIDAKPSDNFIMTEFSGNPQLDNFLNREVNILRRFFETNPSVYYYQDQSGAENAQAMSRVENYNYPSGTVIIGFNMVKKELGYSTSGTTIPFILAHEFAHIVDFNKSITAGYETKVGELFADFQAGCFLYFRGYLTYTDIRAALQSFYLKGDYEFNNPDHHGTNEERLSAVLAGYNWLRTRARPGVYIGVDDATEAAKEYVGITEDSSPVPQPIGANKYSSNKISSISECSSTFCESLKKVTSGFENNFQNLRGEKFAEKLYRSNVKFPDEKSNYINTGSNPYYYVNFYKGDDIDNAKRIYEDLKLNFELLGLELTEKSWSSSYVNKQTLSATIDLGNGLEVSVNWSYAGDENKALTTMRIGAPKNY